MTRADFSLALLVSGRCNLACRYCYQDARRCAPRMLWPAARAALDHLSGSGAENLHLELTGGEPLLAWGLVRRCIHHARATAGPKVRILLATNGLLLTPRRLDYLVEQEVALRISLDGDASAMAHRAPGTGPAVESLLCRIRSRDPDYFRSRVSVGMTLVAAAVPHFATSIGHLLELGLPSIQVAPRTTPEAGWNGPAAQTLAAQAEEVALRCARRWRETGAQPVHFLRGPGAAGHGDGFLCGAPRADGFCVDPDGRAWGCPMLIASVRRLPAEALAPSALLDLGDVRDPTFPERLASLPERARTEPLFTDRSRWRSALGACDQCPCAGTCSVCPASLTRTPGQTSATLVPEAACAFNRATASARERFRADTAGTPSDPALASALRRLVEEVRLSRRGNPRA